MAPSHVLAHVLGRPTGIQNARRVAVATLTGLVTLVGGIVGNPDAAGASAPTTAVTINATGGDIAADGLALTVGDGTLRARLGGTDPLASPVEAAAPGTSLPNGFYLRVGDRVVGPAVGPGVDQAWDTTSVTGGSRTGGGAARIVLATTIEGKRYVATIDVATATDADWFTVGATVTIPTGSAPVEFWEVFGGAIGGDRSHEDGIDPLPPTTRLAGRPVAGVGYDLGRTAGDVTVANSVTVGRVAPALSLAFSPTTASVGSPLSLVISVHADTVTEPGWNDLAATIQLPAGLTASAPAPGSAPAASTCSVPQIRSPRNESAGQNGRIDVAGSRIVWSGGHLDASPNQATPADVNCRIVVPVTATAPGTSTLRATDVVATRNLTGPTTDATVTLTAPTSTMDPSSSTTSATPSTVPATAPSTSSPWTDANVVMPPAPSVAVEGATARRSPTPTATVRVPAGGSITLVDDAGNRGNTVTYRGEGTYTLDPATGRITFRAAAGFVGTPTPVTYLVTNADGTTTTGRFAPTITSASTEVTSGPLAGNALALTGWADMSLAGLALISLGAGIALIATLARRRLDVAIALAGAAARAASTGRISAPRATGVRVAHPGRHRRGR